MKKMTAISGILASAASADANEVTNTDTGNHDPNKEVDGDDFATTAGAPSPAASPLPALPVIDEAFTQSLVLKPTYVAVQRNDDLTDAIIRRPDKDEYVPVKDDMGWTLGPVGTLQNRDERKFYVVAPAIESAVPPPHLRRCRLFTAISSTGEIFLWAVPLEGKPAYMASVHKALDMARRGWVRVVWNERKNVYDSYA